MKAVEDKEFSGVWTDAVKAINTGPRLWHVALQGAFALHPVIRRAVHTRGIRPIDWQQLLLEWPHVSEDDGMKLAYTRDEKAGADFVENGSTRQTKTSIGKYVARHWPHVPDHTRRDWVALYTPDEMCIVSGIEDIICAVEQGPQSCMVSRYRSIPFNKDDNAQMLRWLQDNDNEEPDWSKHPYAVYTPDYGWQLAVHRGAEGRVEGRALCWMDPQDSSRKVYVRSYIRGARDTDRSETDTSLEAWLGVQGYRKQRNWPEGVKFSKMDHPDEELDMMPYLDADCDASRTVRDMGTYFVLSRTGEYVCDNTDGTVTYREDRESIGSCEHCGNDIMEDDDYTHAGRDEDTLVCNRCCDRYYTQVRAEPGEYQRQQNYVEYYIPSEDAASVHNQSYNVDPGYLPEEVVCLEDGDYAERDDCVDIDDQYYLHDDSRLIVVEEEHPATDTTYALKDDCWQDHAGNWHRDDIECVELDGDMYTQERADEIRNERQEALDFTTATEGETP